MSACCVARHVAGAERLFSWLARRYAKRYLKRGLDPSQRRLLQGLLACGIENARVLEIGCGVGYLHQALLKRGAAQATGVDLSAQMLAEAKRLAARQGQAGRVAYRQGDFVDLAAELPVYDLTVLDKVVCCYPEPVPLLEAAAAHTARTIGLVYPRVHLANRLVITVGGWFTGIFLRGFRSYLHPPALVRGTLEAAGFRCGYRDQTPLWRIEVYTRHLRELPAWLGP